MDKKAEEYITLVEGRLARVPLAPYDPDATSKDLAARQDAISLANLNALEAIAQALLALVRKR